MNPDPTLPGRTVALFAAASGLAVANVYYSQPLLQAIAGTFGTGSGTASLLVTLGQIGYAAGLALLVPLGDVVERRRLVTVLLLVVAAGQAVAAGAWSFGVLAGATVVVALSAVVAPILVAFAATLAPPAERGRVAGTVLGGVLAGVLLARTAGGLVAQVGGWRSVYALASAAMVALALVLSRSLPRARPPDRLSYPALLRSVPRLVREEPVLRLRCAYGFVSFAGFSALWTAIAFLLAAPPYRYGEAAIGLFGLAGVAGAYAARWAGKVADRGGDRPATAAYFGLALLGWALMAPGGGHWLLPLVLGVVVLDFGVQALQSTNLSVSYRLRPAARSRVTTAYMTVYFAGGVAGAGASGLAYARGGWLAVCLVGAGFALLGLLLWTREPALLSKDDEREKPHAIQNS
jgi:predicted MFS family arabinose efflux permease